MSRPNAVNNLVNIIDINLAARYSGATSQFLPLRRALELLGAITKEFATVKMLFGMKVMAQASSYECIWACVI